MSFIRRVVHIRVYVLGADGPVRTTVIEALAYDTAIDVVGCGAGEVAVAAIERLAPEVVILEGSSAAISDDVVVAIRELPGAPEMVDVVSDDDTAHEGAIAVRVHGANEEALFDMQGEIVGAVWGAASARLKRISASGT